MGSDLRGGSGGRGPGVGYGAPTARYSAWGQTSPHTCSGASEYAGVRPPGGKRGPWGQGNAPCGRGLDPPQGGPYSFGRRGQTRRVWNNPEAIRGLGACCFTRGVYAQSAANSFGLRPKHTITRITAACHAVRRLGAAALHSKAIQNGSTRRNHRSPSRIFGTHL
jgi:hypothetical protein